MDDCAFHILLFDTYVEFCVSFKEQIKMTNSRLRKPFSSALGTK